MNYCYHHHKVYSQLVNRQLCSSTLIIVNCVYMMRCIQLDYECNAYKTIAYNDYTNNNNNSHNNEYGSGRMIIIIVVVVVVIILPIH